jgi:glycosyltransferase involved in cell wall biosynthesis
VGEGPAGEGLKTLAQEVYPRAEFVGSRHGAQLEPYFASADLFVLPGTGGLAVQEAMAHGLPVIVAQGDGTQEDLVQPENGWIIPSNDEATLKDALTEALSTPARLRQMGAESYRMVVKEINVDVMVTVFIHMALRVTSRPDNLGLLPRATLSE